MVCDRDWHVPEELDGGYAATFGRLRAFYRSRGLTPEDAADLAQEAIARSLLHLRRHGCNGEPVTPLVNRIAANLLVDHLRSSRARVVSLDTNDLDFDEPVADPSEEVARRHVMSEVRAAVAALPLRHRHALSLSLDGRTPAEIADDMGIRRNAADALLFRARRGLAERLRAVGVAARVLVVLAALRVRAAARRATDLARSIPSAMLSTAAGMNVATAAIVSALALSAPASAMAATSSAAAAGTVSMRPPSAVSAAVDGRDAIPAVTPHSRPQVAGAKVSTRYPGVKVTMGDHDNEHDNGEVGAWYEPDPDDPGLTGPIVETAGETACGVVGPECEDLGGTQ